MLMHVKLQRPFVVLCSCSPEELQQKSKQIHKKHPFFILICVEEEIKIVVHTYSFFKSKQDCVALVYEIFGSVSHPLEPG